jgi:hypothetical protein
MRQKNKLLILAMSVIGLMAVMSYYSPINSDLKLYLAVYSLIYIICFIAIWFFIDVAYQQESNNHVIIAAVLAFTPVSVLAVSSLSSLSLMDVALSVLVPLIIVGIIIKRKPKT